MSTTKVRIGDVLELERVPATITPSEMYLQIGIRSYGNGIFHRDPCRGDELSKLKYYILNPDRLVVSNIMAWEGAIALSGASEYGFIASSRFLSYRKIGNIDLTYLSYFFQSAKGASLLRGASTGTVTRNQTVTPKNFENIEIPLPGLDEQRRIAAKLSSEFCRLNACSEGANQRVRTRQATFDAAIARSLGFTDSDNQGFKCLGDVARINPRPARLALEDKVAFVPMSKVNDRSGSIEDAEHKRSAEIGKGYKQFASGDVLFARITPCMQNGKSAVFRDPSVDIGLGSTEFHVVRSDGSVSPEWLHAALRSRSFRDEASRNMSGTAGQQRISASFLESAIVPVPSNRSDEERVLSKLSSVDQKRAQVESLHKQQEQHLKALRSSLLNAAFSGKL